MNPMTWTKAWVAGIAAPIADWLVGLLAAQVVMPDAVQVALVTLLVGVVVYAVPNAKA